MEKTLSNPFKIAFNPIEFGLLILLVFSGLILVAVPLQNQAVISGHDSAVLVPWLIGFIYFICSVWIFGNYRSLPAARTYTLLTLCISLVLATWNYPVGSAFSAAVWSFGITFGTAAMVLLAFRLFSTQPGMLSRKALITAGASASIAWLAALLFLVFLVDPSASRLVSLLLLS